MPRKTRRAKLKVSLKEHLKLQRLVNSRTAPASTVQRAKILWLYHVGQSIADIRRAVAVSRNTIYKCIDRSLAQGVDAGLKDASPRTRRSRITTEARLWVKRLAQKSPRDCGYDQEAWSRRLLAFHVRAHAVKAGHLSLLRASKATIHRILKGHSRPSVATSSSDKARRGKKKDLQMMFNL